MTDKMNDKVISLNKTPFQLQALMVYVKQSFRSYIERQEKKIPQRQKLIFLWTLVALYAVCLIYFTYSDLVTHFSAQEKYGNVRSVTNPPQKEGKIQLFEKESLDVSKSDTTRSDKNPGN